MRVAFDDMDCVVGDMLRPPRDRELGPLNHRDMYHEARGKVAQLLSWAEPPPTAGEPNGGESGGEHGGRHRPGARELEPRPKGAPDAPGYRHRAPPSPIVWAEGTFWYVLVAR